MDRDSKGIQFILLPDPTLNYRAGKIRIARTKQTFNGIFQLETSEWVAQQWVFIPCISSAPRNSPRARLLPLDQKSEPICAERLCCHPLWYLR